MSKSKYVTTEKELLERAKQKALAAGIPPSLLPKKSLATLVEMEHRARRHKSTLRKALLLITTYASQRDYRKVNDVYGAIDTILCQLCCDLTLKAVEDLYEKDVIKSHPIETES
jgi:hypothetical protein